MTTLKPQDVAVVLYLCRHSPVRPSYAQIAVDLALSPSEVHGAVKRAQASHLLHGPGLGQRPNLRAIEEFLIHGLKYVFPAEHGELTRGVPTSYAAKPLRQVIAKGDGPPPVWPYPEGPRRGLSFTPLYKGAPKAALRDRLFYELLALVDALRDGRARERKLAEEMIISRLRVARHD